MPNPYVYTGPGTRWVEKNPTAEDLINISRENNDFLYETVSSMVDPLDPATIGTWENPYIFGGGLAYLWIDDDAGFFRGKLAALPVSKTDGNLLLWG